MTADVSPVERLARAGVEKGRELGAFEERTRVLHVIKTLPLSVCHCDALWLEVGVHSPDCRQLAELAYQARVLDAIFTAVPAAPEITGGVGVPLTRPETGSGVAGTVAEAPQAEAV